MLPYSTWARPAPFATTFTVGRGLTVPFRAALEAVRSVPYEYGGTPMFNLLVLGSMAASLLVAPAAGAAPELDTTPSSGVTFSVVTVNGSGCPAGTARVRTSADNTSFTVTYDDYVAEDGARTDPTDFRRNCQINLLVSIPQGFTYAVARAEYRGHAKLAAGARAQQNAYYYFTGTSPTAETNFAINGPYNGSWKNVDEVEAAALVSAPCGAKTNLNINTDLVVRAGSAESSRNWISMDKAHGDVDTIYHVSWKHC